LNERVLTCLITRDWRKTTWVKFSASPVASTNHFFNWWCFRSSKKSNKKCIESTSSKM